MQERMLILGCCSKEGIGSKMFIMLVGIERLGVACRNTRGSMGGECTLRVVL